MIELVKKLVTEVPYIELYNQIFTDGIPNLPTQVYMAGEDGKYIGLLSGFPLDPATWYLQVAGFLPNERGKKYTLRRTNQALDLINLEWQGILTLISNDNNQALRFALAVGFKIIGIRIDSGKNTWVELLRLRGNDNATK